LPESFEQQDMVTEAKIRNIQKGEAVFRIVIGLIFIGLAFLFSGVLGWLFGLTGIALLLTAFFRY
jgi:hypothetical protein